MRTFQVKVIAAIVLALCPCIIFGESIVDESFEKGVEAYKRGDYKEAYTHFHQVSEQTKKEAIYYIWLGSTCKKIYDSGPKSENLQFLIEGARAYKVSFERNPADLHSHYNSGRMMVLYAIESARNVVERELFLASLETQPSAEMVDDQVLLKRQRESALDSVKCLLAHGSKGLSEIWNAVLERERNDRLLFNPSQSISDTLEVYITFYVENALNLFKIAYYVDFEGFQADYYTPKIAAACRRGEGSSDPQWFKDWLKVVQFDGGYNMRSAICRLKGRDFEAEEKHEQSIQAFEKAIRYARTDSSAASLYTDLAHIAYKVDLRRAVKYDRMAYDKNPLSQVIRDNYVGHSLNLSLACIDQGRIDEAITYIRAVTLFRSNYQAEAFIRLARAYLKSSIPDAHEKAVKAARDAYRLDPKYKKEYREILIQLNKSDEVLLLDSNSAPDSSRSAPDAR